MKEWSSRKGWDSTYARENQGMEKTQQRGKVGADLGCGNQKQGKDENPSPICSSMKDMKGF